ncbi:hypothetical protein ES703_46315 [subsurface metagenome]
MYFQRRYLKEDKAFVGTSGLETIDLPNKGLLSCVEFTVEAKCGVAGGSPDVWLHDCLEKVELIVDGSKVVKSLTGEQILALNMYQKCFYQEPGQYQNTNTTQRQHFLLNLGRFYHDLDYMMDLGKVNDPEVRITFKFDKTGQNGWDSGRAFQEDPTPKYSMIPHLLRESEITPKGYIKTSEIYRYTSAASRKENMIIPRGPLYNGLYLQSRYYGEGLSRILDHIEVNINNGELIPFRVANRQFLAELRRRYGEFRFDVVIDPTPGGQFYPPLEYAIVEETVYMNSDIIASGGVAYGGYNRVYGWTISDHTPTVDPVSRLLTYIGILPHFLAKIPYLDEMDERTWIDSKELGDFWVGVEQTDADATHATVKLLADEVVRQ